MYRFGYNSKIVIWWMELSFGGGDKSLVGGESSEEGRGGGGMSKFSASGGDDPIPSPSPPHLGKNQYVATANCMVYVLFHDHQNELKTQDVKLTSHFWPLLSIRKFPVQT